MPVATAYRTATIVLAVMCALSFISLVALIIVLSMGTIYMKQAIAIGSCAPLSDFEDFSLSLPTTGEIPLLTEPLPEGFSPAVAARLLAFMSVHQDDKAGDKTSFGPTVPILRQRPRKEKVKKRWLRLQEKYPAALLVPNREHGPMLSFRGQSGKWESGTAWDYTEQVVPAWGGGAHIHRGFVRTYEPVRENMLNALRGKARVWLVGYSLGCVLAQLAALDLLVLRRSPGGRRKWPEPYCVTAGGPALGDSSVLNAMGDSAHVYAMRNVADFVCMLPPVHTPSWRKPGRFLRYVPCGTQMVFYDTYITAPDAHLIGTYQRNVHRCVPLPMNLTMETLTAADLDCTSGPPLTRPARSTEAKARERAAAAETKPIFAEE